MNLEPIKANSITQWLLQAREGDDFGRQQLWVRYFERLVRLARNRLTGQDRRVADEEDVAVRAFDAFFRALDQDKLKELSDREGVWRLLVTITDNKANDLRRHLNRKKRGGGQIRGHSAFDNAGKDGNYFDQIPDPSPDFADDFRLVCEELLMSINPELRKVAVWKMEGYTNREIALELGCVEESVRRKVVLIRTIWTKDAVD